MGNRPDNILNTCSCSNTKVILRKALFSYDLSDSIILKNPGKETSAHCPSAMTVLPLAVSGRLEKTDF